MLRNVVRPALKSSLKNTAGAAYADEATRTAHVAMIEQVAFSFVARMLAVTLNVEEVGLPLNIDSHK